MADKESDFKIRVADAMKKAVKAIADERGETMSLVVRDAIRDYLAHRDEPSPAEVKPVTYWKTKRKKKASNTPNRST